MHLAEGQLGSEGTVSLPELPVSLFSFDYVKKEYALPLNLVNQPEILQRFYSGSYSAGDSTATPKQKDGRTL